MEFLIRGAIDYGETGVFIAFEETPEELAAERPLARVRPRPADRERQDRDGPRPRSSAARSRRPASSTSKGCSSGSRIAIDSVGAKRVVLDTIETLFGGFTNQARAARGAAAPVPLAQGQGRHLPSSPASAATAALTRQGLEEYVSDCVILLDHRVNEQVSTRRLRIVKYRGSLHGTNEYPFLIDERGISVLPVTGLGLNHDVEQRARVERHPRARHDARRRGLLPRLARSS